MTLHQAGQRAQHTTMKLFQHLVQYKITRIVCKIQKAVPTGKSARVRQQNDVKRVVKPMVV